MATPKVLLSVLDNQLGIRGPSGGKPMAIIAPASAGTLNLPSSFSRTGDVVTAFGSGPLVELAAYAIEHYGNPVVCVRCDASVAAAYGAITDNVAGTSVPTADVLTAADDEYEVYLEFIVGGTVGTGGITYKWSLDGGRTLSAAVALGTATSITIPGSGGVKVNFAAGTLLAGDNLAFRATPALPDDTELDDAMAALQLTGLPYRPIQVFGALDDSSITALSAALEAMAAAGKHRYVIGNVRPPAVAETEAQYAAALTTLLAASVAKRIMLCGGYANISSSISRRQYSRPISLAVAPLAAAAPPHIDLAEIDLGALPGVVLRDANQNPVATWHDEDIYPGLDDLRLTTLRSQEGYVGAYITNPRLLSQIGSDFKYRQYLEVVDIACEVAKKEWQRRLSKRTLLDTATGFIRETEAGEIESAVTGKLKNALLKPGYVSGVTFVMSRDDNVISTETFTGKVRVVPLGYPKFATIEVGLSNPANVA